MKNVVNEISQEPPVVQVALAAAVAWSAWSLVPVAVGALAALLVITGFAASLFGNLGWMLGIGVSGLFVTLGVYMRLPAEARGELKSALVLGIKIAVAGSVGIGSMGAIISMMPPMPSGSDAPTQGPVQNISEATLGLPVAMAFVIAVVVPVLLALIAVAHAVRAHKAAQSVKSGD